MESGGESSASSTSSGSSSGTVPPVVAAQPQLHPLPVNIPLPDKLELQTGDAATNWRQFKRVWSNYEIAANLLDPDRPELNRARRAATLLTCFATDALDVYDAMEFDNEDQRTDPAVILAKMEVYCIGETNETYERYVFNKREQEETESVDAYVTALRKLAQTCNYGTLKDSLIRDRMVVGIRDKGARKKLLQTQKLTLPQCITICRSFESSKEQMKEMDHEEVRVVADRRSYATDTRRRPVRTGRTGKALPSGQLKTTVQCKFCGNQHFPDKKRCPAWGKSCNNCGLRNHFASCCNSEQKVHAVYDESDEEEYVAVVDDVQSVGAVDIETTPNKAFATLIINGVKEDFQLDSGATVNIMSDEAVVRTLGKDQLNNLEKCGTTLIMFNQTHVKPLGKSRFSVTNPKNNKRYNIEFVVVKGRCRSLLGLRASQQLKLLTVNTENILTIGKTPGTPGNLTKEAISTQYSDVFAGEGKLEGELQLEIDQSVPAVQLPTRRVAVAIRDKLKEELARLSAMGMITKVETPTDWVSALVVTTKKNGKLRLCIDPQPLNRALKRNHYPLPTIEDVLPSLARAKVFSVLDAKNGFWHIQLDEPSSYATTFGTPWGRFRWLRMPFGISPAPEEFQRRVDVALEGLEGLSVIADDLLISGSGDTVEEAYQDHDRNLIAVLDRCREKHLKLNLEKMQFRQEEVHYMGHVLSAKGLQADPTKVRAIKEMPPPTDKQGVRRVLGMANYVQRFAPHLADLTKPLRDLLKKENAFVWEESIQGQCLEGIKQVLTQAPVLKYFDNTKQTTLQCDASMGGLGACLMQDGHPIAYASRSLTQTEVNYAQIEKELLAIVFGMEKFEGYVYGRRVLIESDHKPLESIMKKSLLSAPKRLQRMLLRLQKYDYQVVYKKGEEMYMADTLSRAYIQEPGAKTRSPTEVEAETINMLQFLPVKEQTLTEIQQHTEADEDLSALSSVIKSGWPKDKRSLPPNLQCYFTFREELVEQQGIVFKGERAIVPSSFRPALMEKLHASHLGVQGCLRRAREAFYWPGMNNDIMAYISRCSICNAYKPEQQKEPMLYYEIPSRPWESISADLFDFQGSKYLVTTDRHSNFFELDKLRAETTSEVISKLKPHMARYGLPNKLTTDNGPQFASAEFAKFAKDYKFQHIKTSPRYPKSNGKAENSVKTGSTILKKASDAKRDPHLSLLDFRNTPTEGMTSSPAQRMLCRRTRTLLPMTNQLLKPKVPTNVKQEILANKKKQVRYHDIGARKLKVLKQGETVRVKPLPGAKRWFKARVKGQVNVRSYEVTTEDGRVYRRNRRHLYKVPEPFTSHVPEEPAIQSSPDREHHGPFSSEATYQQPRTASPPPGNTNPAAEAVMRQDPTLQECEGPQSLPGPAQPLATRSGRVVRAPAYLKDYAT